MQIGSKKVVSIAYTLKNDAGEVVDTSVGRDPLVYIQGIGSLVSGLEKALEGKDTGAQVKVSLTPEEGYGARDESLIRNIPIRKLPPDAARAGSRVQVQTDAGPMMLLVTAVKGDYATVDPNHPLSGKNLHFEVEVKDVRDATADELSHGHVHTPGDEHAHAQHHAGHDQAGHDHAGHDHAGHDHAGHDHAHSHPAHPGHDHGHKAHKAKHRR
jgi:FKBP-type peptidyl-prolyl cis-trans isomerase SlyD